MCCINGVFRNSLHGRPLHQLCCHRWISKGCPACRLILVDAHALLYRSHFGFRAQRLETAGGEDTSISYGFLSTVLRLLEIQEPPTHFAVVMDHHGKTFR